MTGPRRRVSDHVHPEYWTETDHNRFEDRVAKEVHDLRTEVRSLGADLKALAARFAWLMGALAVLVFVANAVSIYILRAILPPN